MKKLFVTVLTLALLLTLAACSGKDAPAPTDAPTPTAEATPAPSAAPETPAPTPESAGEEPSRMAVAESFVGGEAAELIAAIGEPISADYASSCLGSGEDGILEYEDFLVYTYRNGESERVDTVLPK